MRNGKANQQPQRLLISQGGRWRSYFLEGGSTLIFRRNTDGVDIAALNQLRYAMDLSIQLPRFMLQHRS